MSHLRLWRRALVRRLRGLSAPQRIPLHRGDDLTMRSHHAPALLVLAILAAGQPAPLGAQQRATPLEGVWRLLEEVDHRADGSVIKTGPDTGYNGLLIFTGSGYMSSTIMPKGRTWKRDSVSPAELRETFEAASAHAGQYECDTTAHTVRMENVMALDPADEGNWDVVRYRVQRDTLELSGDWTYNGEKLTFAIRLERVK
jgi:hypothetical protein